VAVPPVKPAGWYVSGVPPKNTDKERDHHRDWQQKVRVVTVEAREEGLVWPICP
jgi:hypothetical protein